jgi:DNA-directed RNA polymerase specialized sigma24 family protein
LARRPRRCAASWSRTPAARGARSTAAGGDASTPTSTPSTPGHLPRSCWPCTRGAWHAALGRLAAHDPLKAKLVELRFFAGLTLEQAAGCLGVSLSTADRAWRYARAWLYDAMAEDPEEQ